MEVGAGGELSAASAQQQAQGAASDDHLGQGEFTPPKVIIGCWQLLERDSSRENAVKTLAAHFQAGFTALDTADIYGPSEGIIGDFRGTLTAAERSRLQVYTKFVTQDGGLGAARRTNANSRQSLGYDGEARPLDLVQYHWWDFSDPSFQFGGTEGQEKHIGFANFGG